jgi:Leucine rich repeat variant
MLAVDPDPAVRAAVADAWWDRPADVHVALLTDTEPAVRAAAARRGHPPVPAELHAACLADPATRAHVAHYAQLTPELGMSLATDPDDQVRQAAARNPALPAEAVARLVTDPDPSVQATIALHRLVDDQTRDQVYAQLAEEAQAGSIEARVALEWNFLEPDWVCEEPLPARLAYLDSPHVAFRRALARSRNLPPEVWQRLDDDPDWRVRRHAAMRPDVPATVLERLVREHGDDGPFRPGVVEHPHFPREVLPSFADAADPRVRRLTLHDASLPRPLLARLASDTEVHVRRAAAAHPRLDVELFTVLLADEDAEVVANAAANESLPVGWMYQILDEAGL